MRELRTQSLNDEYSRAHVGDRGVIHVAVAADKKYLVHLEVMLYSLRRNLNAAWNVNVHVLSSELSERDLAWKNRLPDDELHCVKPPIAPKEVLPVRERDHVTEATYYRLYVEHLFPEDTARILYLDCDLVVLGDLATLAETELGDCVVGAVRDYLFPNCEMASQVFNNYQNITKKPYFNAGVLVIDLPKWRNAKIKQRALSFLSARQSEVTWWDQDALNYVLVDSWRSLDPRWNRTSTFWQLKDEDKLPFPDQMIPSLDAPYVVHFTGAVKPWNSMRHRDKSLYDHYLIGAGYGYLRYTWIKEFLFRLRRKITSFANP